MKKICLLMMCALLLTGCGKSYEEADKKNEESDGGYFVTIKEWDDNGFEYSILYAKNSKVKYLKINGYRRFGITPLYNADGSLQIYDGE